MKEIKKIGAQGDVLFMQVGALPTTAVLVQQHTEVVVAHSETGHNHIMKSTAGGGIELFMDPSNPLKGWVKISASADVVHHRPWDTHETLRLLADSSRGETIWEIRRQRERAPEGWRRVED
jgi:hypothetical protein